MISSYCLFFKFKHPDTYVLFADQLIVTDNTFFSMSIQNNEIWHFVVEWYDPQPQMKRRYALKYYLDSNQVEMIDLKNKRLFLKKSECPPEITPTDFYLGSKVVIFSRELEVVDYGDQATRQKLQHQMQRTIALLTPDSYHNWGKILDLILRQMNLVKIKMVHITLPQAEKISGILSSSRIKTEVICNGLCLLVCVNGEDGIAALSSLAQNIYHDYGSPKDPLNGPAILSAKSGIEVNELIEVFADASSTATFDSCTCCLIKPHAVKDKLIGSILDLIITQGYEVSAVETLVFDRVQAEEFLEVYKGT